VANIIFDFDGTLADTLAVTVKIFEGLLRGGEPMHAEEIERLRGLPLWRIGSELRILPWKVPYLVARGRAKMRREIPHIQIFPGVPELLHELNADGHKLYIVSSNSVRNINLFLKRYDLRKEFIRISGGSGLLGKRRVLKRFIQKNRLDPAVTYYVGDEIRDIEAAHHAGLQAIAVTKGYNNEAALREHKPDFVAHAPAEIRKIINAPK
jgi:phosphoglycolate phosphatase